jgi:predicted YcjX-like family ATPase
MDELALLLLRLEDLEESAENKEVRILAKAFNRYLKHINKEKLGFGQKEK